MVQKGKLITLSWLRLLFIVVIAAVIASYVVTSVFEGRQDRVDVAQCLKVDKLAGYELIDAAGDKDTSELVVNGTQLIRNCESSVKSGKDIYLTESQVAVYLRVIKNGHEPVITDGVVTDSGIPLPIQIED